MAQDDGQVGQFLDQRELDQQEADREAKEREQTRKQITKWAEKIRHTRHFDRDDRLRWAEDRKYARGESDWAVSVNLIMSIIRILISFLYAKNPDINARPSPSVGRAYVSNYRKVGETIEIVVSRLLINAGLKKVAKRWVRNAMIVGIAWIRVSLKTRTEPNTLAIKKLNDLQEQLDKIEALRNKEGKDAGDEDIEAAEIRDQITALEGQREMEVHDGLILDNMAPEDVVVSTECGEIENYLDAPWIAFDFYKTFDEALAITGWSEQDDIDLLKSANTFVQKPRQGEDEGGQTTTTTRSMNEWVAVAPDAEAPEGFIRMTEIWSKDDGVVYTMIDGITKKYAKAPFAPVSGRRFYPVFDLMFHAVDGERYPPGDVAQLKSLQDEYASVRSNFRIHRQRSIPGVIFDKGTINEKSIKSIVDGVPVEYIGVDLLDEGKDLRTLMVPKAYPPIDQNLYTVQPIIQDMEKVSGVQDALQGSVQVEKTATEARIEEAGRGARSGERLDTLEDSLTELAQYVAEIALQKLDATEAQRYAGPEALWDLLTAEQAMNLFMLEIKAGSTGKPKEASDRELWGVMMPLIEKLIDRIGQARIMRQEWAAKPWIALLAETFQRLDEPAELEKFLPVPPEEQSGQQEPSEEEKAEIELKKSQAAGQRADAITKVPFVFPNEQAMTAYFLFGGQPPQQEQPPPDQGQPELQEAPEPISRTA